MTLNEIGRIVWEINNDIYECTEDDDGILPRLSLSTNGDVLLVQFGDSYIWDSENDERDYCVDEQNEELDIKIDLECYIRSKVQELIKGISKIMVDCP